MNDMLGTEWDLAEVLAERAQPKTTVTVYLNEVASFAKAQLMKEHATAKGDEVARIDADLTLVATELEASKYVIHLTAIPSRMREDIASKALSQLPVKPNIMGQDDMENSRARRQLEDGLIWLAQIADVVNPHGQSKQSWTLEEMQQFSAALPTAVQNSVDVAIRTLTNEAEQFTVGSQSPDF